MKAQEILFDEITVVNFAGGGGADTGISIATGAPVTIAVNHDPDAIRMHRTNHPYTQHLQEDVFDVDPVKVCAGRPVGIAWFSPDCRHFSKAKGGKPVEKKIRGLSWVILRWALAVRPRVMFMENVEEIQTWGPLIQRSDGKWYPDPDHVGETFKAFIGMLTTGIEPDHPALMEACEFLHIAPFSPDAQRLIRGLGYDYDGWELVAADYGAPTIRKRYFGVFRCDGQPIVKPKPTHSRDGKNSLPKWRSAAEIINWSIPCPSIFASKAEIKEQYGVNAVRPLADNTLKRVARGVDKFTIRSGKPFIVITNHSGGFRGGSIDDVMQTVTAKHGYGVAAPVITPFYMHNHENASGTDMRVPMNTVTSSGSQMLIMPSLIQYHSEKKQEYVRGQNLAIPIMTIDGSNRYGLAAAQIVKYFGTEKHGHDMDSPCHTITSKDREALTTAVLSEFHGKASVARSVEEPVNTQLCNSHTAVVTSHIIKFKGTNIGQIPHEPLQTLTAGGGEFGTVYTTLVKAMPGADLKNWPKIRALLNKYCSYILADDEVILLWINGTAYFIADIGMRMLTPRELYNAQGFPPDYMIDRDYLGKAYSKTAQVARCGNAVCPPVATALVRANIPEMTTAVNITTMAQLLEQMAV
ncbi:DNA cytosine methyltransferase [Desulfotruncus arcticus]|uniref:DNA cytosine methyltransferase n=1 Tax=Desulfotruncus arcticus TaxID=341036 RepID=UPI001EE3CA00|nr:DNA cytosine methyltransferase [Desulfotruncus arcticus]